MSARRDREEEEDEISSSSSSAPPRRNPEVPLTQNIPETVEDFLRNFLGRLGLSRTLSSFEEEWYRSAETRRSCFVPDALTHGQILQEELGAVRRDTELLGMEVLEAEQSLVRMRRERDFHRLQHRRVSAQKESLAEDRKQLQEHLENCQVALNQLEEKHRAALRTKALLDLQRERAQHLPEPKLHHQEKPKERPAKRSLCRSPKISKDAQSSPQAPEKTSFQMSCSIRAHQQPVSCIALHPRNPLLASASDDRTWKLWHLPRSAEKVGQVLLRGEAHSDWLSGCTFHPDGSNLATTSGDTTVEDGAPPPSASPLLVHSKRDRDARAGKDATGSSGGDEEPTTILDQNQNRGGADQVRIWDLSRGRCVSTLSGHSQPTWGCWFHSCGHLLASCSADRTAKLWDVPSGRCRLTLRRHAASVNSVAFLPSSDVLLTCSADKTLVLWDARLGVAAATFRGHRHPCNHAAFSPAPHAVASCDSRGVVNLWDTRKPASPTAAAEAGPRAANQLAFSQSGKLLAVASADGSVRLVAVDSCGVSSLTGHGGSVQSVTFDHEGRALVSAGSDGLIGVWF